MPLATRINAGYLAEDLDCLIAQSRKATETERQNYCHSVAAWPLFARRGSRVFLCHDKA